MLFDTSRPDQGLHPSFLRLRDDPRLAAGRALMGEAFGRFDDRDGNFTEQFQTTGFDSRTFELYVSELLRSAGFTLGGREPQPDFQATKDGITVAIECTTTNPTDDGKGPRLAPYGAMNEHDRTLESVHTRAHDDLPYRVAGALRSKMTKGVKVDGGRVNYWDLPQCRNRPFVLAIQTFHEDGALSFSDAGLAEYLYGIAHKPVWDAAGNMSVETRPIESHTRSSDGKSIRSGFFAQPDSRHVSGVLWSNAGTVPKFVRMGLQGPYPSDDVIALRFGTCYDPDPNAHAPLPFVFVTGSADAIRETWGQEAVLYHNPNASHPIPEGLFDGISEASLDAVGIYGVKPGHRFFPYMSYTNFFTGPKRFQEARVVEARMWQVLEASYALSSMREENPLWS